MKDAIKKVAIRLLILIAILIIIDIAGGAFLRRLYLNIDSGQSYKTTYAVTKSTEPMIILGSSRAYHHYVANAITDSLGIKCYNLGRAESGILYDYAIYNTVCQRSVPRYVLLDINPTELAVRADRYDVLSQLLPFYGTNKYIDEIVNQKSHFEFIKVQSALYRYNSLIFYMLINSIQKSNIREENGYLALEGSNIEHSHVSPEKSTAIDTSFAHYFEMLLKKAVENKIKIFVFVSPDFRRYDGMDKSMELTKSICERYNVPFYNFLQDKYICSDISNFYDNRHLNREGSLKYTNEVIRVLKNEIAKESQ